MRKFLLISFLFMIFSCDKAPIFDPQNTGVNSNNNTNNNTGSVTFYYTTNSLGSWVTVTVDGAYTGTMTTYITYNPGCGASTTTSIYTLTGLDVTTTHSYSYTSQSGSSGSVNFSGSCNTYYF